MILHLGERVFWGASEVIYLEGNITRLDKDNQSVLVHIDRATPNSAHLIDTDIPFAANGVTPLRGDSPAGTVTERRSDHQSAPEMSDNDKIRSAATVAVRQKYGYALPTEKERAMIDQVAQVLNGDPEMRSRIIASMNKILQREK
jgi:hypothetical protein